MNEKEKGRNFSNTDKLYYNLTNMKVMQNPQENVLSLVDFTLNLIEREREKLKNNDESTINGAVAHCRITMCVIADCKELKTQHRNYLVSTVFIQFLDLVERVKGIEFVLQVLKAQVPILETLKVEPDKVYNILLNKIDEIINESETLKRIVSLTKKEFVVGFMWFEATNSIPTVSKLKMDVPLVEKDFISEGFDKALSEIINTLN